MSEYLYVAVNKSMPGLVKVGTTTREPRDRLRELHTTGVPTPFDYVVVLIVADGKAAERAAHKALDEFRTDRNREFFTVKPVVAVRRILKVVETYEIDWDNTTNLEGISELDRLNKLYLEEKDRKEEERLAEKDRKNRQRIASEITDLGRKISELDSEIEGLAYERRRLGTDPGEYKFKSFQGYLILCLFPLGPGFFLWALAFQAFDAKSKLQAYGEFTFAALGLIFVVLCLLLYEEKKHNVLKKPFVDIDEKIKKATASRAELAAKNTALEPKEAADVEVRQRISKLAIKIQQFDDAISKSERDRDLMGPRPAPINRKNASKALWLWAVGLVLPAVFIGATYGWLGLLCLFLPAWIAGLRWWEHCADHNKKLKEKYDEQMAPFKEIDKLIADGKAWRAKLIAEKTQLEAKK